MMPEFGRLERKPLRSGWKHEAAEFTPWLSQNLDRLSEALDLPLIFVDREHAVGRYSLDLLLEDGQGRVVIVENQIAPADHDHLGKLLTYCAGTDAKVLIWIAEHFNEEHVAALEWLNENSLPDVGFFALEVSLLQIGESPLAPDFKVVVRPNEWAKQARSDPQTRISWDFELYASELHFRSDRIELARRAVAAIEREIEFAGEQWQRFFRKGYVVFQRSGGYNVMGVDLMWRRPLRIWVKLPAEPTELAIANPYPNLETTWSAGDREWGWTIPPNSQLPDLQPLIEVAVRMNS
jgi:hypothetical protein